MRPACRLHSALPAVLVVLLACLVSLAHASQMHFTVSAQEQAFLNALHAPEALPHARQLDSVFAQLDANADGVVDSEEAMGLEAAGELAVHERMLMHAFDSDGNGELSHAEFTMAPYTLNMLETGADVSWDRLEPVPVPSAEEAVAEAAFEGAAPRTSYRRLRSRANQQQDTVLSEMSAHATAAVSDPKAAKGGKRGTAPLPVSLFGVPSVADEECVMCQYFVQRIQNGVADRLENAGASPAPASSAGAAGLPGAAAAAQQALKVRNTNSQLSKKPGGRGVVRTVAEDIMAALCAVDKMPLLFNPYCSGFVESNTINAIRKGIFFNIPTVEVCSQAALCRDDSYLNTNAAVHATKTSLFLNGQRGICGMLGGARERPNSREGLLISAVCDAHGAVFGPNKLARFSP